MHSSVIIPIALSTIIMEVSCAPYTTNLGLLPVIADYILVITFLKRMLAAADI